MVHIYNYEPYWESVEQGGFGSKMLDTQMIALYGDMVKPLLMQNRDSPFFCDLKKKKSNFKAV